MCWNQVGGSQGWQPQIALQTELRCARPPRFKPDPGSQAEMYLSRALDALHRAGNPPELWIEPDPFLKDSIVFGGAQQILTAQNLRLQALRSCMLFAAITVEAFANEFAYHALGAQTAKTIDNLGPAEKIDTALRLAACNGDLLDRGRDPFQTVVTLVKTRNRLVHPKPVQRPGRVDTGS